LKGKQNLGADLHIWDVTVIC